MFQDMRCLSVAVSNRFKKKLFFFIVIKAGDFMTMKNCRQQNIFET